MGVEEGWREDVNTGGEKGKKEFQTESRRDYGYRGKFSGLGKQRKVNEGKETWDLQKKI